MQCISQQEIWVANGDQADSYRKVLVPCNKCLPCLSNKRVDWAFRIQQEWRASKSAFFVTLTYDQKHVPADMSLDKRHLQLFFKRLRKNPLSKGCRIRYYAVGEYGTETQRPHYHVILFNAVEQAVRRSWCDIKGNSIGIVDVRPVNEARISYCLKYIVQPLDHVGQRQKPFALMSRGYGIGLNYLTDEMVSWHRSGDKNYAYVQGVQTRLPRYYKDKIWYNPDDRQRVSTLSKWFAIKQARKELRVYVKKFGVGNAKKAMKVARDRHLARIKIKVAYSQTL